MRKKLLIVAIVGILAGIYGFHAPAVSSYLITEKGVDIIRIGRPFTENPPKWALYDRTEKKEYGFTLYRADVEIGEVTTDDNTNIVTAILLYDCPVHTDNGISIGSPIREAVSKNGVSTDVEFYLDEPEASPYITLKYKGITILLSSDVLSSAGKRKLEKYDTNLMASDFNSKGTISGFSIKAQ